MGSSNIDFISPKTLDKIERQIARNEELIQELESAHVQLRTDYYTWLLALTVLATLAIFIVLAAFLNFTSQASIIRDNYIGQTVAATFLALIFTAIVVSFYRFMNIRKLLHDVLGMSEVNARLVKRARWHIGGEK